MKVKCNWCGREFEKRPDKVRKTNHNLCSLECSWKQRRNRVKVECEWCGKEFDKAPSHIRKHNFCSHKCCSEFRREHYRGLNHRLYTSIQVKCDWCGKEFSRQPSLIKKHTFCSYKCYWGWLSKNQRGKNHPFYGKHPSQKTRKKISENHAILSREKNPNWKGHPIIECEYCHKKFEVKLSRQKTARFCSSNCLRKWCSENLAGENSPLWKGGREPYYGLNWRRQNRRVLERDDYICQICGREEDGRALDVHHIIPFREFGLERYKEANQLSNLITLCRPCHVKADRRKIPIDTLRGMVA